MKTNIRAFLILCIGLLQISCAQEKEKNSEVQKFPFTDANWSIMDKEGASQPMDTTLYDNKLALHLPVGHAAFLKNQKFKNFVAEFDVIGFVMPGLGFRLQDTNNYELIYLRVNSSGKDDALQYIPIHDGNLPWQLYNYPKYEAAAEFATELMASLPLSTEKHFGQGKISDSLRLILRKNNISFSEDPQLQKVDGKTWGVGDAANFKGVWLKKKNSTWEVWNPYVWTHVKIVVHEKKASVYIENMDTPKMEIENLKRNVVAGGLCLKNQFFDAFFTDVSIVEINEDIQTAPKSSEESPLDNYLTDWKLSPKFKKNESQILRQLDSIQSSNVLWKNISSDEDGLINISRFIGDMSGTVALKKTISSESDQLVKMNFGFAKNMIVVLNDKIVFNQDMDTRKEEGRVFEDNQSLELNISKGENKLYLILTGDEEYKQNWGLISKLETLTGLSLD